MVELDEEMQRKIDESKTGLVPIERKILKGWVALAKAMREGHLELQREYQKVLGERDALRTSKGA